jgi:hypothetical protein
LATGVARCALKADFAAGRQTGARPGVGDVEQVRIVVDGEHQAARAAGAAEGDRQQLAGGRNIDRLAGAAHEVGQAEDAGADGVEVEAPQVVVARRAVAIAVECADGIVEAGRAAGESDAVAVERQNAAAADEAEAASVGIDQQRAADRTAKIADQLHIGRAASRVVEIDGAASNAWSKRTLKPLAVGVKTFDFEQVTADGDAERQWRRSCRLRRWPRLRC